MKRFFILMQVVFGLFLLTGCQKESTIEVETLAIEPEIFRYAGTEEADTITIDENGLLYTSDFIRSNSDTTESVSEEGIQRFSVYDLDGTCLKQTDITLGNAIVSAMLVEEETLYCIIPQTEKGQVLVAIDLTTWAVRELAVIPNEDYITITKMVAIGDYFYLFGKSIMGEDVSYNILPNVAVNYSGEVIGRISRVEENPSVEFLNAPVPLDIFKTKDDTLMIYYYHEERGFGFFEFFPEEQLLKEAGWKYTLSPMKCLSSCEEGYLFIHNSVLHYGTVDGMETQITTNRSSIWRSAVYTKGFAFYYDYNENMVERVCVTDTLRENKTIHLLINLVDPVDMYSCGYRMLRQEVDMETFSLKVLAQDSDFDLYLLNTVYSNAYNIKKNGVFYPLNEVPGVQEYLDACFPNLKEVATNEDGDIWMIPIHLDMPLLLYDTAYGKEQGIDISTMDYQELLSLTERAETENPGKIMNAKIISEFFAQYFYSEDSFDTEVFREYMKQLKSLYESLGEDMDSIFSKEYVSEILPEFFYDYIPFKNFLSAYAEDIEIAEASERVKVIEVPKITEEIPSLGTCTFFAVNPQSENLEATLAYISTLCRYLLTLQDSFLLADRTTYSDNTFIQQCYDVYSTGEIYFAMDEVVYYDAFMNYLEGSMTLEEMIKEMERRQEMYLKE